MEVFYTFSLSLSLKMNESADSRGYSEACAWKVHELALLNIGML